MRVTDAGAEEAKIRLLSERFDMKYDYQCGVTGVLELDLRCDLRTMNIPN